MPSHINQRPYNGLTGLELRTIVLKQLATALAADPDPAPALAWRKQAATEIDRQLGLDDRFRQHIAYPLIAWGWDFQAASEPDHAIVKFAFTLKVETYPTDVPEWTVLVSGAARPPTPGVAVPAFTTSAGFGQDQAPPDKLRKQHQLPVPGQKSTEDQGRVDLTAEDVDRQLQASKDVLQSF